MSTHEVTVCLVLTIHGSRGWEAQGNLVHSDQNSPVGGRRIVLMKESCGISIAPLSQIDEVAGEIKGARKAALEGKQGLADILPVLSHANARTHAGG